MPSFLSLGSVLSLWLGVSFILWLGYRLFRQRNHLRERNLVVEAQQLIETSTTIFDDIRHTGSRQTSSGLLSSEESIRNQIQSLLNAIETQSSFFDRVNITKKSLLQTFQLDDYPPLSEILQIRRDFWAAAEIFLINDVRGL